jgi:hypothetical protein
MNEMMADWLPQRNDCCFRFCPKVDAVGFGPYLRRAFGAVRPIPERD